MLHLFDEDGKLYDASNYKKSIYALLLDKDTKVSNFYETDSSSDFLPKDSNIECNTAYFTFKMRFKYKLLDFVVQFELGNGIYQDSNEYNQNDTTINGNLIVTNDITVNNNVNISNIMNTSNNIQTSTIVKTSNIV